jgi:predicted aldo/keto reductase-like oxidoreductase
MTMSKGETPGLARRDFLVRGASALGAGLLGASGADTFAATPEPRVRRYVPLGRTGMKISEISFGSSRTRSAKAVRHAFERGVNYFDSAEGYKDGDSEEAIGKALHDVRDRVYLTSKTKAGKQTTRHEMMQALEGSLDRLRTDYVDVYFNHAVNDVDRLQNEEWHEFTERAKQQGKIRFRGMSGHAGRLVECLSYALDHKLVDVILAAYNFGQDPAFHQKAFNRFDFIALQPELPSVLKRAHRKGVGVVAMKTLMGARANDMRPYEWGGATFSQAAFRWALSNPDVDALVISMKNPEQIDEYLGASGEGPMGRREMWLLERYAALNGGRYCQHGCGICEGSCPRGVPISEVLRTRMYDIDYGDRELARRDYAQLGDAASPCLACAVPVCAGACSNGIPIAALTRDAARRLG